MVASSFLKHRKQGTCFFFLYMFLANQRFISHNLLLCCPSQRSARSQVPSQVATHQTIGSQLWAGEMPDSNPGLQDNSQVSTMGGMVALGEIDMIFAVYVCLLVSDLYVYIYIYNLYIYISHVVSSAI
jgi:hypothetical protein